MAETLCTDKSHDTEQTTAAAELTCREDETVSSCRHQYSAEMCVGAATPASAP